MEDLGGGEDRLAAAPELEVRSTGGVKVAPVPVFLRSVPTKRLKVAPLRSVRNQAGAVKRHKAAFQENIQRKLNDKRENQHFTRSGRSFTAQPFYYGPDGISGTLETPESSSQIPGL